MKKLLCCYLVLPCSLSFAQNIPSSIEEKVIQWRHEIHQNPELSNREFKTAQKVADHMRGLEIEVQTGIAHTGAVSYTHLTLPTKA